MRLLKYDVIVVGGGHAGCEASLAAAKMGLKTVLITMNIDRIGQMSCNPAIGGTAKGHLVKEIDALGGEMGHAIDRTGIQFRVLNKTKGPAIWSSRAQADMDLYKEHMRKTLEDTKNLDILQDTVASLLISSDKTSLEGVITHLDQRIEASAVILTTGTFLNGLIHIGEKRITAGRAGEPASIELAHFLKEFGFQVGRMKTGTTPRIDARTIDFARLERQDSDPDFTPFSMRTKGINQPLVPCYITYTNEKTHEVIKDHMHLSPLYSGIITGIGPRYCPSIEDKVKKFPDRLAHQIFLEPEGYKTHEIYPNGISTSLPIDVQEKFLRTIVGLEQCVIMKPGYAIEYDFVQPTELHPTLETKKLKGLYFAGQLNGTTGYEEAAAQGLMAGINAACKIKGQKPFILSREESYIGVLIDDLTTLGTNEPYRMFTSRAENRLRLREDNADLRLTPYGYELGLIDETTYQDFSARKNIASLLREQMKGRWLNPSEELNGKFESFGLPTISTHQTLETYLKRPEVNIRMLKEAQFIEDIDLRVLRTVETEIKYDGYIKREDEQAKRLKELDHIWIPKHFSFEAVSGLSREICEKLKKHAPSTLGQASRISGVTPAALSLLYMMVTKGHIFAPSKELTAEF
jgi:tRNA uridine 5-carboxymethylaminomethyl modification enzyme